MWAKNQMEIKSKFSNIRIEGKKSEKQKNAIKKYYKFLQCARRVH